MRQFLGWKCFYINMDDKKIIKLFEFIDKKEETAQKTAASSFHTNPIIQEKFLTGINNKKSKFSIKDLLK